MSIFKRSFHYLFFGPQLFQTLFTAVIIVNQNMAMNNIPYRLLNPFIFWSTDTLIFSPSLLLLLFILKLLKEQWLLPIFFTFFSILLLQLLQCLLFMIEDDLFLPTLFFYILQQFPIFPNFFNQSGKFSPVFIFRFFFYSFFVLSLQELQFFYLILDLLDIALFVFQVFLQDNQIIGLHFGRSLMHSSELILVIFQHDRCIIYFFLQLPCDLFCVNLWLFICLRVQYGLLFHGFLEIRNMTNKFLLFSLAFEQCLILLLYFLLQQFDFFIQIHFINFTYIITRCILFSISLYLV